MPDTGETQEIKPRIDAKEVQIETASKKLLQKLKTVTNRISGIPRPAATKKTIPSGTR
jgi:hypothetical protein